MHQIYGIYNYDLLMLAQIWCVINLLIYYCNCYSYLIRHSHRRWNSLEQSGAGVCTIATSSSNYMKERRKEEKKNYIQVLASKRHANAMFNN